MKPKTELRNKNRGYMNLIVWQKAMELFELVWKLTYVESRTDFKLRSQIVDAAQSISANIARLTALGVQVHITELDVALPVDANGIARTADLQSQADVYRQIAQACVSHPGCSAIQTWGFTDKYSWIPWFSKHKQGAALIFDREYRPKQSYGALRGVLQAGHPTAP
jgi:GH35 family endo-1,4-beta-xylanase